MRIRHLKVKIKSLAAEASIIRHEERQVRGLEKQALIDHRRGIVRNEARHSLLAYGFLRHRPYRVMEATAHYPPDWERVRDVIRRFGGANAEKRYHNEFERWTAQE